jgi:hypothetical protein
VTGFAVTNIPDFPRISPTNDFEVLHQHLGLEWLHDRHIAYFTMTAPMTTRSFVDAWYEGVMRVRRNWDPVRPLCLAVDISDSHVTLTPYMRDRAQAIYKGPGQIMHPAARIAFVTRNSLTMQFIKLFIRWYDTKYVQNRLYMTQEEALSWLRDCAGITAE